MISAIIIDDIQKSRALLLQLLQQNCPQITVIGMAASANEGQLLILEKKAATRIFRCRNAKWNWF